MIEIAKIKKSTLKEKTISKFIIKSSRYLLKEKMLSVFIIMFIAMIFLSPFFLTVDNFLDILLQMSAYGIIACGMTIAIICGEFDLSVGSVAALCGLSTVILSEKIGLVPAIICSIILGGIIGLINGLLVSVARINSFVVTLSAMVIYYGVALKVCNGNPIQSSSDIFSEIGNGTLLGVPYPVYVFIIIVVLTHIFLTKTAFGRNIFATGGNYDVAKSTGINVKLYKSSVFVLASLTASIGGILLAARLGTGSPNQAQDAAMTVISAVVIGGTSLVGGQGSVIRTLLGLSILGVLTNALNLLNVYPYLQLALKGIILITVVATDSYYRKGIK